MAGTTLPLLAAASSVTDATIFLGRVSGETVDKKFTGTILKAYIASDTASLYYNKTQSDARYQPLDADLTAIAGLTSAADRVPYFTGSGTAALATLSSYARTLIDDADASAARGTLGLGTIATQDAASVSLSGGTITGTAITGLATPTNGSDAATKDYVDASAAGMSQKKAVRVATTAALTASYSNGTAGVGATLTNSGTQVALALDGVTVAVSDRILVKNQASALQNGIYTVTNAGSGATNWILTRATDFDAAAEISEGAYTIVEEGTPDTGNQGTLWIQTNSGPFTVGTTAISWTQLLVAPQTKTFTGDVTGTGTQSIALTIGSNKVLDGMLRQSSGLSIIGRSANSTGNVADITSAADGAVLRQSGTAIGFGAIALGSSSAVTGTLLGVNGGTGQATTAVGDLLQGASSNTWAKLSAVATGNVLLSGGLTTASSWGKVGLSTHISGTLGVGNGGTGNTTYFTGDILVASGSSTLTKLNIGMDGQFLGVASGNLVYTTPTPKIPVGTLFFWSTNSPPAGALECDGSAISRTTYLTLFNIIGTTYGVGNGTTTFNLPDDRGYFLRGWDHGAGRDSGRSFGSVQSHQLQDHIHTVYAGLNVSTGGNAYSAANNRDNTATTGAYGSGVNVGTETRPMNRAYLPCIQYA